jgi:hypothetical protein
LRGSEKRDFVLKQEDKLRDKPGYEHLNDPLHVLVEAEFPASIVDAWLNQVVAISEDLLKPLVRHVPLLSVYSYFLWIFIVLHWRLLSSGWVHGLLQEATTERIGNTEWHSKGGKPKPPP